MKARKYHEPHSLSVKHGMEPMKMMVPGPEKGTSTVQRVKESCLIKRASFLEENKRSGQGTCQGSFIREEEQPNVVNQDRSKEATGKRGD